MGIANRDNAIDWLKVIGMFLIIWGHCFPVGGVTKYIYGVSVPLFFFISGYLVSPMPSLKSWFSRNFYALVVPYFALSGINLLLKCTLLGSYSGYAFRRFMVGLVLGFQRFLCIDCAGAMWFVFCLFFIKLVYQVFCKHPRLHLALVGFCVCAAIGVPYLYSGFDSIHSLQAFLLCYPFFFLGTIERKYQFLNALRQGKQWRFGVVMGLLVVVYGMSCYYNDSPWVYRGMYGNHYLLFWMSSLSGIVLLSGLCSLLRTIRIGIVRLISDGTIVILALHGLVLSCIQNRVFYPLLGDGAYLSNVWISVCVSLGMLILFTPPYILFNSIYLGWAGNTEGLSCKQWAISYPKISI